MELNLQRPLLFFDIESTGLNIANDCIIELSFVKLFPGGEQRIKTWKVQPWDYARNCQKHIDPKASEINGVTDDMLVGCPRFSDIVTEVAEWLTDSDLAGFNSGKFDLPMLAEEIERARIYAGRNVDVNLHDKVHVDVQTIYHMMEPRNLRAAYRFYCGGEDFENAHTAEADTLATCEVLKSQLDRYPQELKNDVGFLSRVGGRSKFVDYAGRLIYNDRGEAVINFGKHKDKTAREVFDTEPSYFSWIQNGDFTLDTKAQFARLAGQFRNEPPRPASAEQLDSLAAKFNEGRLF